MEFHNISDIYLKDIKQVRQGDSDEVQRGTLRGAGGHGGDTDGCGGAQIGVQRGYRGGMEGIQRGHGEVDILRTLKVHHCLSLVTIGCP